MSKNLPSRTQQNEPPSSKQPQRGRWRRKIFAIIGLLLLVAVVGWLLAGREAGRRVQEQLADLNLGQVRIGQTALTMSGVSAGNIRFTRDGEDEPWLVVGKLQIEEPLGELATGSEDYDRITLNDVQVLLDADELIALASSNESAGFDLSVLELPSDMIAVRDASIRVTQPGREDLMIRTINADILADENGAIQVSSEIDGWLNAGWTLSAEIRKNLNEIDLIGSAGGVQLPSDWQKLPGVPSNLDQYLDVSGVVDVEGTLEVRDQQSIKYLVNLTPQNTALRLPAFDLDLEVDGGTALVADGNVEVVRMIATADGTEKICLDGSADVDSFPIEVDFDADFEKLSVATVRKLVPDIPNEVDGRATGSASGKVSVTEAFEISLELDAKADNVEATYGKLQAGRSTTEVQLQQMKLGSDLELIDLRGTVAVHAAPEKQSADDVFETFLLTDLQRQLNVHALFDGELNLEIPLATAGKLETWRLAVEAEADSGSIDDQPLEQIQASVRMKDGNLLFDRLTAQVPGVASEADGQLQQVGRLSMNLDWPVTANSGHANHGQLTVSARQLPVKWALAVGQSQLQTASQLSATNDRKQKTGRSKRATIKRKSDQPWIAPALVDGWLNADAQIKIDAAQPDNVKLWQLQGTLSDSMVATEIERLDQLRAQVQLSDGQLKIEGLDGQLQTGSSVQGEAKLDVMTGELSAAALRSKALPFAWVLDMARLVSPEARQHLESIGIRPTGADRNVDGRLAIEVGLRENDAATDGWQLDFQMESKRLMAARQVLDSLQLSGSINDQKINLEKFSAKPGIPDADGLVRAAGELAANGIWSFSGRPGSGSLRWNRTPVSWVAGWLGSGNLPLVGTTSGLLDVTAAARDRDFPAEIEGLVSFERVGLDSRFRTSTKLQIETDSDANQLLIRSDGPAKASNGFDFHGRVSLQAPYEYSGSMKFESLSLKSANDSDNPAERMLLNLNPDKVSPLQIEGLMTGDVDFAGQVQPFMWSTGGQVAVSTLAVEGQKLTDVEASWNVDNRDFSASKADLKILGGQVKIVETAVNPNRISVSIDEVSANELSAFAGPTFPVLEGRLSGDASINEWDVIDKSWAQLRLRGASARIVGVRLSDLGAEAEYRQQELKYKVSGRALDGTITGDGSTNIGVEGLEDGEISFPLDVNVNGAELQRLAVESNRYQSLKQLRGEFSAKLQLAYQAQKGFDGVGKLRLASVAWGNELLTRVASTDVRVKSEVAELSNLQADLRRGKISGRAMIPLAGSAAGNYQVDIKQFDLARLLDVAMQDPISATGFLDARLTGQLGKTITGRGTLGFDRAKFYGVAADSLKLPVQFRFDPARLTGRVEMRQSTIRALHGRITGEAAIDFGRSLNVDVDLGLSRIDTADLLVAVDPLRGQGQGKLSGQLVVRGRSVTRSRDLKGRFTGSLDRAQAFRVPLLSDFANVAGGGQLSNGSFDSERIDIRLANDRISVINMQLESSLANVSIGGDAYLDGRLDLAVAARIDNFGQPSGFDQLAGIPSPLVALRLIPAAQAVDALSGRNVFAKVGGTISRPIVRLDAGQQLRAEAARYFLRGRQILPNVSGQND